MSKISRFLNSYFELPKRTVLLYAVVLASIVVGVYFLPSIRAATLVGDVNGDGTVNVLDLSALLSHWNTNYAAADLNHDGTVSVLDLSLLLSHWGQTATASPTPSASPTATPTPTIITPSPTPQPTASQLSTYVAANNESAQLCLDDKNNSSANNNPIIVNICSAASLEQQWSGPSDSTVRINGQCLTPQGGSTQSGTAVVIAACNGSAAQQWKAGTDPTVSMNDLKNVGSGLCLNVTGVTAAFVGQAGATVDSLGCNGTDEQVWGWNTNGTITPGGATFDDNCPDTTFYSPGSVGALCYIEAGALQQQPFNATGLSVTMSQAAPAAPVYSHTNTVSHTVMEVWAGGGNPPAGSGTGGNSGVEVNGSPGDILETGWIINGGETTPHLFVTYWQNNNNLCLAETAAVAQSCGFVSTSSSVKVGNNLTVGATGTFKIVFAGNQWQFWYNGAEFGYFPESIWTNLGDNTFTSITYIGVFAEVELPAEVVPQTQMGNGILGDQSGSAAFSNFSLTGSSNAPDLTNNWGAYPISSKGIIYPYTFGHVSTTGFTVGGPGM